MGASVEREAGYGAGHASVSVCRARKTYLIDVCCDLTPEYLVVGADVSEPSSKPQAIAKHRKAVTLIHDQRRPFIC